jgi:hypothetical protein
LIGVIANLQLGEAASGPGLSILTDFAGEPRLKIAEFAGFYLTQEA